MLKYLLKSPHVAAALVSVFCFIVYLRTLAPTVGFIDSGELATVACTLGVAHPTGYPLFTLVGWVFSKLPIAAEEIVRLNIMSAFFCTAGLYFFFLLVHELFRIMAATGKLIKSKPQATTPVLMLAASICATMVLGFSETYWSTAVSVEVYSIHVFFLSLVTYVFIRANFPDGEAREGWWWLFGFSLGLSFTNHMTTILLAPGFLFVYFLRQGARADAWKRILRLGVPFLAGLSLYAYLPIRAAQSPYLNWGNPVELERFLWHLSGKQYSVWIFSSTEAASRQLSYFINMLPAEFAYIGLAIALVGLVVAWRAERTLALMLLLLFFSCLFYSINYDIHDIDSYFLLAYVCVAVWVGIGTMFLLSYFRQKDGVIVAAGMVLGVIPLAVNYSRCDESTNYLVEDYTQNMIDSLRPGALIFSYQWDYWVSASYYYQKVKGIRPDITVVDKELLRRSWYLQQLKNAHPWLIEASQREVSEFLAELYKFEHDIPYNSAVIQDKFVRMIHSMIKKSLDSRPVYATYEIESEFITGFQLVPEGLAFRLEQDSLFNETPSPNYRYRPFRRSGRLESQVPKLYGSSYGKRAAYYYNVGKNREEALSSFRNELEFDPSSMEAQRAIRFLEQSK